MSIYATTYSSSYTDPRAQTRAPSAAVQPSGTGFAKNSRMSPLSSAPGAFDGDTTSHSAFSERSSLNGVRSDRQVGQAIMEKSGYSRETGNIFGDSPARRAEAQREREINASHLDPVTYKRMQKSDPIAAENGGAGPAWGSTASSAAFTRQETAHERFARIDRDLIGQKQENGYTREKMLVGQERISDDISTMKAEYVRPERPPVGDIPNRTVMQSSGYAHAETPTIGKKTVLADASPDELSAVQLQRLKQTNTPEYTNVFHPDPYASVAKATFQDPEQLRERGVPEFSQVRKVRTGYDANEHVTVGAPGDARTHKTGKTEKMKTMRDPETLKTRDTGVMPNVVQRSGYWGS